MTPLEIVQAATEAVNAGDIQEPAARPCSPEEHR